MQTIVNQLTPEINIVKENLLRGGMTQSRADECIQIITDENVSDYFGRNKIIKEVSDVLKGQDCALQKWYVNNLLSKITKLTPTYIARIAYDPEFPTKRYPVKQA